MLRAAKLYLLLVLSSVLSLSLLGCSGFEPVDNNNVRAAALIGASFTADSEIRATSDKASLVIKKSALDKEFLLHVQMLTQTDAPRFQGLKSRIIAFKRAHKQVLVLEATKGHVVTEDIPATIVIASLPILKENSNSITVDFNSGFSEIYTAHDWRASDINGPAYAAGPEFKSTRLKHAYLANIFFTNKNELTIIQRGQLEHTAMRGYTNSPVEARYYISPYEPNPSFQPLRTTDFKQFGFFEVAPQYTADDVTAIYASRLDPSQERPFVFAISANTPTEFREAVREGALYWNGAFGYEKIQVIDAPKGVSAPHPEYNVLQWVNWDTAGMAYADAQMDPRTGEIRHAQVYMTSVFGIAGKHRARQMLRKLQSSPSEPIGAVLKGFESATLCDHFNHSKFSESLAQLLATNPTDAQVLQVSQDYVRHVMAHEVGHTLGLRHNFAGSLHANRSAAETQSDFEKYVQTLSVGSDHIYTSSVMEYTAFTASAMNGRQIIPPGRALDYDKLAIDYLYNGKTQIPADAPLFCTDSLADQYLGCRRSDIGYSPVEDAQFTEAAALASVPQNLLERLILAKFPIPGANSREFDTVEFNTDSEAKTLMSHRARILAYLMKDSKDLKTHRSYSKVDSTNSRAVRTKQLDYFEAEAHRLGGMGQLFPAPSEQIVEQWTKSFNQLVESDSYKTGIGFSGKPYALTSADITKAKAVAAEYFAALYQSLIAADMESLKTTGTLVNSATTDSLHDLLFARAKNYVFASSGNTLKDKINLPGKKDPTNPKDTPVDTVVEVELPLFLYDLDLRIQAASLLAGRKTASLIWGLERRDTLRADFKALMKSLLKDTELDAVKVQGHSAAVGQWLAENKAVAAELAKN